MAGRRTSKSTAATAPSQAGPDTEERIFLAAERLFADRGFDGVSVRDIVHEAGVNLAAVSYHFGSKSSLLLAIFRKRTREMNRERHALLREAEARAGGAPPLREILRALLGPPILWKDPASGKDTASRFISRAMAEVTPELRNILESDVSHLKGFVPPMARTLPHLSEPEVCWALHFAVGLPHQCTDANFKRVKALSDGQCDTADVHAVLERAIQFALGGIEALGAFVAAKTERAATLRAPGASDARDRPSRNER
ncbi:MAG: TetR family transcriptional regulator [Roseiarcus sp.]|jgi:AcrR family transcriptional regulator